MRIPPMQRRTVLRGMLRGTAVACGLPTLEAMLNGNGTAYAQTGRGAAPAARHLLLRQRRAAEAVEPGRHRGGLGAQPGARAAGAA